MRLSKYLFKVNKTKSDDIADRLIRGCFIQKECSGIFRFTNLGLRVIEKIKSVIRSELDKEGCLEVALPILQDLSLWTKSGRDTAYGKERFSLKDRKDATMVLAPTAEESAVEIVSEMIDSYKQLPVIVYQMIEKYRDEMRPRFGLIRSRQFTMKDAYSFALNDQQAEDLYIMFYNCYLRIFKKMEIEVFPVPGGESEIGGKYSHEFVVLDNHIGECSLFYDELNNNKISSIKCFENLKCGFTNKSYKKEAKCLELGEIFYLGDRYSTPMKAFYDDKDGKLKPFIMGCYGIGVSRVFSYLATNRNFFPEILSPFGYYLVGINDEKSENFYNLIKDKIDILYDDREQSAGVKFNDADLIGIPKRITIGQSIELKNMITEEITTFNNIDDLIKHLK